jgi:hypothetical protein
LRSDKRGIEKPGALSKIENMFKFWRITAAAVLLVIQNSMGFEDERHTILALSVCSSENEKK